MKVTRKSLAAAAVGGALLGVCIGLLQRGYEGPTGRATGDRARTEGVAIGASLGGGGWITLYSGMDSSALAATQVPWGAYARSGGEARPVPLQLDDDEGLELAVGLAAHEGSGGGWVVFLEDPALKCRVIGWRQVSNEEVGTRIAGGDLDGDGRDEVVVGMERGGTALVLDDATRDFQPLATLAVPWKEYATRAGETRPAVGDLDGDGRAEVVLGLGRHGKEGGFIAVFREGKFVQWVRLPYTPYNDTGAGTWPACGDTDGDGIQELVVGTEAGAGAYAAVISRALSAASAVRWVRLPWDEYARGNGSVRASCAELDGDERSEMILSPAVGIDGSPIVALFDDARASHVFLGWRRGWAPRATAARAEAEAPPDPVREAALGALRERRGDVAVARTDDGRVSLLTGDLGPPRSEPPAETARRFVQENLGIWGPPGLGKALEFAESRSDLAPSDEGLGPMVSLRQTVSGVPLPGHELNVHMAPDGSIQMVSGEIDPVAAAATLDPNPRFSAEQAIAAVEKAFGDPLLSAPTAELAAWRGKDGVHLVWEILAESLVGPSAKRYRIDAGTGAVLDVVEEVAAVDTPRTIDNQTAQGHVVRLNVLQVDDPPKLRLEDRTLTNGAPAGPRLLTGSLFGATRFRQELVGELYADLGRQFRFLNAVTAHWNTGRIMEFWWRTASPGEVVSMGNSTIRVMTDKAHLADDTYNAWTLPSGTIVTATENMDTGFTSLDILAHEFTHVVNFRSAWIRGGPGGPGGVLEHVCDAHATFMEKRLGSERDLFEGDVGRRGSGLWLIGEEVRLGPNGIRNVNAPPRIDHVLDPGRTASNHAAAGPLNKFLFLWVNGGRHPESRVQVIGLESLLTTEQKLQHFTHLMRIYRSLLARRLLTPGTDYLQFRLALERAVTLYVPVVSFTYLQASSPAFEAVGISAYAHSFTGPRTIVRGTSGRLVLHLTNRISTRENVQIHARVLPPRTGVTLRLLTPSTIASIPSGGTADVELEIVAPTSATLGPIEIEVSVDDRLTPPGAIVFRHPMEVVPTPPPLPCRMSWAIQRTDDDGDHLWEFEESGTLTIRYTNTERVGQEGVAQEGVQVRILPVYVSMFGEEDTSDFIPIGAAPAPVPIVLPGEAGEVSFVMPFRLRADPHVVTAAGGTRRDSTPVNYYVEARDAAGRTGVSVYRYSPVYYRDQ